MSRKWLVGVLLAALIGGSAVLVTCGSPDTPKTSSATPIASSSPVTAQPAVARTLTTTTNPAGKCFATTIEQAANQKSVKVTPVLINTADQDCKDVLTYPVRAWGGPDRGNVATESTTGAQNFKPGDADLTFEWDDPQAVVVIEYGTGS